MKKEFTSTLSHELRTPLTSIIGSLQLINSRRDGRRRQGRRRAHHGRRAQRPAPARPDQRHPRHREDRVGQADARARGDAASTSWCASRWCSTRPSASASRCASSPQRRPAPAPGARRPQAPAAGDDQPAVERGQVLARRRRRSRSAPRTPGRNVRVAVHDRGRGIPGELSAPHLRPLHAGRLDRHAAERRHRPRPRDLQAPDRADAGPHRLRRPRRRRHHVLVRAAARTAPRSRTHARTAPEPHLLRRGRRGHPAHRAHVARARRQDDRRGGQRPDAGDRDASPSSSPTW